MIIDWAATAELLTKVGGIIGGILILYKYFKQILLFIKDFFLIPKRVKFMLSELSNNGGMSIKDMIQRMENRQISNELKLIYVVDSIENAGSFESDSKGECIKVSVGYCHLIGRNEEECLGSGWLNYVHPEDRDKVWKMWEDTIENQRYFISTYRMIKDGNPFSVFCRAYPLVNTNKKLLGWFGIIKKV